MMEFLQRGRTNGPQTDTNVFGGRDLKAPDAKEILAEASRQQEEEERRRALRREEQRLADEMRTTVFDRCRC